jgi:hypothetical protein
MNCVKSDLKKYRSRPGPPYPAQACKKQGRLGNDGEFYMSEKDKNGVYKWIRKTGFKTSASKRKTSRKASKRSKSRK